MSTQVILPRIMQVGEDASLEIPNILVSLGCKRPLIITDKMMVALGYAGRIQISLGAHNICAHIFDDTMPEPTVKSIQAGVEKAREGNYDCIIALGGGSPIDSAKAIAILAKHGGVM